ncbi:MAG: hypothetical protein WCF12_06295 [Propionicimonas sp.]
MNRFETLLAPPSLSSKDLSIHINMHPEIPKEVSGKCKNDFANVATRLHDELTTLRFGRTLADSPAPARYQALNQQLTGSTATPIDWKFFADEFTAFKAEHPQRMGTERMLQLVSGLSDPWRVQAWAAQALRIAQNAETEDSAHAGTAWRSAVKLYATFLARADVTQSHTYRSQTDPCAQATCQKAWQSFLADEVAALARRVAEYGNHQQAAAASAALAALAVPEVSAINPEVVGRATAAAQDVFLSGIKSATTLRAAFDLYFNATASDELDRALLAAMTAETAKLAKGFGGGDEVDLIELGGEALGLGRIPDDQVGSLMRAARNDFYESATTFARTAINENAATSVKQLAARVLALLPPGREAGSDPTGESITVGDVLESLMGDEFAPELKALLKDLMEAPADSAREEAALDNLIAFAGSHPAFAKGRQVAEVLETAYSSIFGGAAMRSLAAPGTRGLRMMEKIQRALPPDATIAISGTARKAAEWINRMQRSGAAALPVKQQFGALRIRLLNASVASAEEQRALSDIIAFAQTHNLAADESEWLRQNLLIMFQNSAGSYLENPVGNARCLSMMRQIMEYLPSGTRYDFGGRNATLMEHLNQVQAFGALMGNLSASGIDPQVLRRSVTEDSLEHAMARVDQGTPQRKAGEVKLATAIGIVLGLAVFAGILWGWGVLATWIYGMFAGNLVMQIIVVLLAVLLPMGAIRRMAKI